MFKKAIATIACCTALATSAFAMENVPAAPSDFGTPIVSKTFVDEAGATVTENTYFVPDFNPIRNLDLKSTRSSGGGWFKKEKTFPLVVTLSPLM